MKLLHSQLLTLLLVTTMWWASAELKRLRQGERRVHPHSACPQTCPCCSWSEFRAVISTAAIDECYTRDTSRSKLSAAIRCDPYQVAYMSYDYERGEKYCGTSASDHAYLSNSQAVACENVIQNKIDWPALTCRQGDDFFNMCYHSRCTADCPCCADAYPEYVQAMETDNADSCYAREDMVSDITAIIHCEEADTYSVAYMSYDYNSGNHHCATSVSALEWLTYDQAAACETQILNKAAREGLSCDLYGFDKCTV